MHLEGVGNFGAINGEPMSHWGLTSPSFAIAKNLQQPAFTTIINEFVLLQLTTI